MSQDRGGAAVLDRLRSRRWAIYAVWVAVLVVSFAAGGATLGLLVDYESVGTDDDPNTIQVVGNWAGFAPANDAAVGNVEGTETDETGMGNTDETDETRMGNIDETDETTMGNTNETEIGNVNETANVRPPTVGVDP